MSDQIERLLAQMPKMAEAVNAFASEEVQKRAFTALMREFRGEAGGDHEEADDDEAAEQPAVPDTRPTRRRSSTSSGNGKARGRSSAAPTLDKGLNLRPKGAESFADFAVQKAPRNVNEQNVVAVYYLDRIAGQKSVTTDQVYSAYKDRNWRVPKNFRNALQKTAAERGWVDTKNMDDIKITIPGENHVEHDLPPKKDK